MQIKGAGKQMGIHENEVLKIDRFIKRLQILRRTKKDFMPEDNRRERIQLIRGLRVLQAQLSNLSKPRHLDSPPFIHTFISGKRILLRKLVWINRSTTSRQISHNIYSKNKIDQTIKQFIHLKNNFAFYWGRMDKGQRTSLLRFIALYAKQPVFKNTAGKTMKSSSQNKNAKPTTSEKKSMEHKMERNQKQRKNIQSTPKKITEQKKHYNPNHEEDFDIYIDSILEDAMSGMDEMQDSTEALRNR